MSGDATFPSVWARLRDAIEEWVGTFGDLLRTRFSRDAVRYHELGVQAYEKGDKPGALEYLKRANQYAPGDPLFASDLGQVYYELGEFNEAEGKFRSVLKASHSDPRALKGLAYALHAQRKLSEAVPIYLRFLANNGDETDALVSLGGALEDLGDHQQAIDFYLRAKELDPHNEMIFGNLGRTMYAVGRLSEAAQILREAIEQYPNNADFQNLLALTLEAQGDTEQAIATYRASLEQNPKDLRARISISRLLDSEGKHLEAVREAQSTLKALEQGGDKDALAQAYGNLGWYFYECEDWKQSIEASRRALESDPQLYSVRFNLGLALLHDGAVREALEEYERGANDVSSPRELRYWAIEDLKEAAVKRPALDGVGDVLELLASKEKKLEMSVKAAR